MRISSALLRCAAPLVAGLVLALGAAACGGSDDGAGSADDERQARAAVERLYAAIADGDAQRVCDQLNEDARRQLAEGGLSGEKSSSCTASFQKFLDQAEEAGGLDLTLKAKVRSVEVDGDTAVAKVTFGKGIGGDIALEKVDGDWKLEAAGASPSQ